MIRSAMLTALLAVPLGAAASQPATFTAGGKQFEAEFVLMRNDSIYLRVGAGKSAVTRAVKKSVFSSVVFSSGGTLDLSLSDYPPKKKEESKARPPAPKPKPAKERLYPAAPYFRPALDTGYGWGQVTEPARPAGTATAEDSAARKPVLSASGGSGPMVFVSAFLAGENVDQAAAARFADSLRDALRRGGYYSVLMPTVPGGASTYGADEARMLGCKLFITGKVSRSAEGFTAAAELFNEETQWVMNRVTCANAPSLYVLIQDSIPEMVRRLTPQPSQGLEEERPVAPESDEGLPVATLTIRTAPSEATVYLDGNEVGPSPQKVMVMPGEHTVYAVAGQMSARNQFTLQGGADTSITLKLVKNPAVVRVTSDPTPVEVFRGRQLQPWHKPWKKTPLQLRMVDQDSILLHFFRLGCRDSTLTIHFKPGLDEDLLVLMSPADEAMKKIQQKAVAKRSRRTVANWLLLPALASAACGGAEVYLAMQDYAKADEYRRLVENARVMTPQVEQAQRDYTTKVNYANRNLTIGAALGGVAGALLVTSIVIRF